MRVRAVGAIAAMGIALPALALGDRATSDRLASDGEALAAAGNFAGAAAKFRDAYAADPQPELICNIGIAFYKLPDLQRAERYLHQCLDAGQGLDAAFLERVRAVRSTVEAQLVTQPATPIDLILEPPAAEADIDVWPGEPVVGSRRVWLGYGHHRFTVHAPGFEPQTVELDAISHAPVVQRVVLVPSPVAPPLLPVGSHAPPPPPGPSDHFANELLVGAGALTLVGIGFHYAASSQRADLRDAADLGTYEAHRGTFEDLRAVTFACYGVAAIAGALGGYLRYRHAHEGPTLHATIGPGVAGLAVEWRR